MAAEAKSKARVPVCSFEELEREGRRVVSVDGRPVLLLLDQGQVFALDNRCPHMGFPLHRGTVKDGILTCHWHHARFDLAGGCTFDPFADDVPSFHAEVRDGVVWIHPQPLGEQRRAHWMRKLHEGLEQSIRLLLAKSVIGLSDLDATKDILRDAALFGIRNRARGWSSGLSRSHCHGQRAAGARRRETGPAHVPGPRAPRALERATDRPTSVWNPWPPARRGPNAISTGSVGSSRCGRRKLRSAHCEPPFISDSRPEQSRT